MQRRKSTTPGDVRPSAGRVGGIATSGGESTRGNDDEIESAAAPDRESVDRNGDCKDEQLKNADEESKDEDMEDEDEGFDREDFDPLQQAIEESLNMKYEELPDIPSGSEDDEDGE